ncbi:MAG: hypothetical protein HFJ24_04195 [Clostridia bacterium]|nr:hypothetical protein [Clostridia bacterium]MCI9275195.1 hypothetical protein [Clostridia bacterium]
MVENGMYLIKQDYFNKFEKLGCKFKDNKSGKRPTFCCVEDKFIKGLFWAIPTSEITKDKNMKRIENFITSKTSNTRSSFYHIGVTNKPCIFCISSCFPIIDKYIEKEYIVRGKHLVLINEEQNNAIKKKLRRILNAERLNPNRFEQKITIIENKLIQEMNS